MDSDHALARDITLMTLRMGTSRPSRRRRVHVTSEEDDTRAYTRPGPIRTTTFSLVATPSPRLIAASNRGAAMQKKRGSDVQAGFDPASCEL